MLLNFMWVYDVQVSWKISQGLCSFVSNWRFYLTPIGETQPITTQLIVTLHGCSEPSIRRLGAVQNAHNEDQYCGMFTLLITIFSTACLKQSVNWTIFEYKRIEFLDQIHVEKLYVPLNLQIRLPKFDLKTVDPKFESQVNDYPKLI